jgi:hypothetical protein
MNQLNIRTIVGDPLPNEGMIIYKRGVEHRLSKQLSQSVEFLAVDIEKGAVKCIDTLFELEEVEV